MSLLTLFLMTMASPRLGLLAAALALLSLKLKLQMELMTTVTQLGTMVRRAVVDGAVGSIPMMVAVVLLRLRGRRRAGRG